MSLTIEWADRLEHWRRALKASIYRPLGTVSFRGFVTRDQLEPAEALQGPFQPMPAGTRWGGKWEYGWFRGSLTLPDSVKGKRVVLVPEVGGESAVFVQGVPVGAVDAHHHHITLATKAVPNTRYDILIEAYAGHGPRVSTVGPVPPDYETVPEPPATQCVVGESTFGVWEEDIYQLWLDVEALYHLRSRLDPDALRVAEIDQALKEFTLIVDLEAPYSVLLDDVRRCRDRLRPLLECKNGSTAPIMYMFGHSHIDVAWLWPLQETERKCLRTFSSQLTLMDEYPEYRFLQSQAHLYWMTKQRYPELYERIREAVRKGQWMPEGGMWVEADTNISGGESLIRQFVHGKRFFEQEFGVDCELLWLPDVFGYSAALPQIMRGCGVKYFSTAKIFWNYHGGDPFPYNTFVWEGIDGSEVLVHLCNDYNSVTDPATVIDRWRQRVQKDGIWSRLFPFGWGDGGGGPTRDHLEYIRRMRDLEGVPRCKIAPPKAYFKDLEAHGFPDARYVGELYFQCHRGTLTSQARTKKGNRQSEFALREAELWAVVAQALTGYPLPQDALIRAWRKVLLNQFHDIIPGSSIHRVYEEAEAAYRQVLSVAETVTREATSCLVHSGRALTVFNSLAWERDCLVALPDGYSGARSWVGKTLSSQLIDGRHYVSAHVPAAGWTTIELLKEPLPSLPDEGWVRASTGSLENDLLRVELNEVGEIVRVYDKEMDREWLAGPSNRLRVYKDVPARFDAWDIDSMYPLTPVEVTAPAEIDVFSEGPLEASVLVRRTLGNSQLTQRIILRRNSRRIDFETEIDWQERHKLLKVDFCVGVHASDAWHEIQFGHIARPNHRSRPFDQDRFEVANHKWTALVEGGRGAAVLNDCKYGVSTLGKTISLTLLRAPLAPDMTADRGLHTFTYALYVWNGSFADSDLIRQAYELNVPAMTVAGVGGERSVFSVSPKNIVLETVKPAEDGSGDVILRLYESKRTASKCRLVVDLPFSEARLVDMLERPIGPVEQAGKEIYLTFRPFEIKTVRLGM